MSTTSNVKELINNLLANENGFEHGLVNEIINCIKTNNENLIEASRCLLEKIGIPTGTKIILRYFKLADTLICLDDFRDVFFRFGFNTLKGTVNYPGNFIKTHVSLFIINWKTLYTGNVHILELYNVFNSKFKFDINAIKSFKICDKFISSVRRREKANEVKEIYTAFKVAEDEIKRVFTAVRDCLVIIFPQEDIFMFRDNETGDDILDEEMEEMRLHAVLNSSSINITFYPSEKIDVKKHRGNEFMFNILESEYELMEQFQKKINNWYATMFSIYTEKSLPFLKYLCRWKKAYDKLITKYNTINLIEECTFDFITVPSLDTDDETADERLQKILLDLETRNCNLKRNKPASTIPFTQPSFNELLEPPPSPILPTTYTRPHTSRPRQASATVTSASTQLPIPSTSQATSSAIQATTATITGPAGSSTTTEQPKPKLTTWSYQAAFQKVTKPKVQPSLNKSTMRKCGARLPSGNFCPRQDKHKCPFHGPIVPRDMYGNCINPTDSILETQRIMEFNKKHPAWKDPKSIAAVKASTGVDLSMNDTKKGKRKAESSRDRLEKKLFKKKR